MGIYLVTARYKPEALEEIAKHGVQSLRDKLNQSASRLNGSLVELYFASGDYRMMAMFEFARGDHSTSLSSIMYSIVTCGHFEAGAVINSLASAEEIDAATSLPA
jgi:uncharacterized protein with GYD domain